MFYEKTNSAVPNKGLSVLGELDALFNLRFAIIQEFAIANEMVCTAAAGPEQGEKT